MIDHDLSTSLGRRGVAYSALCAVLLAHPAAAAAGQPAPRTQDLVGRVDALLVYEGDLVAAGDFSVETPSGLVRYLARWRDGAWEPMGSQFDGPVEALETLQGKLVAGGDFEFAGTILVSNLAVWNDHEWASLANGTDGPVYALRTQADIILYVGGVFTEAGGVRARSVARLIHGNWSALGAGLQGRVNALEVYNGNLVAGGDFRVRGVWERNMALLTGNEWRPIARGIDGVVSALVVWNGGVVAGGNFQHADFVTPARHVAIYNSGNWSSVSFGFGALDSTDASEVRALAVNGGELVAGGTFTLADLQAAAHVARYDGVNWWVIGSGTDGTVETLMGQGGVLYAGGSFGRAGQSSTGAVAGYRAGDWVPIRSVPVGVEDFRAVSTAAGVELRWNLAAEVAADLAGVGVERARSTDGPYETRTAAPLLPASHMTFLDPGAPEPAGPRFYRLALHGADGSVWKAAPIAVWPGFVRTQLQVPYESSADGRVVLAYTLGNAAAVRLDVFDVRGRILQRLESGDLPAGEHRRTWDRVDAAGARVGRGVYLVRLDAAGASMTRKLVLLRD